MSSQADNEALIESFYGAFYRGDGDAMAACYAADARFRDPVFGELTGEQAGMMWRMLTSRAGSDLSVQLAAHEAGADAGSANWIARYTFSQTGRPVVNDIRARFRFAGGQIIEHTDEFSFWTWSRQALGAPGLLLGWTPVLPMVLRRKVRANLDRFSRGERIDL